MFYWMFVQVYQMKREEVERNLRFGGFLVISCPLKQDSKRNIQCLLDSSHYVSPHTGPNCCLGNHTDEDNPLTVV